MKNARRVQDLGLTASAFTTAQETVPVMVPQGHTLAVLTIQNTANLTLAATNEVDFTLQTTYDDGRTWQALCNIHWDNADNASAPTRQVVLNGSTMANAAYTPALTLADDATAARAIGSQLRLTAAFTVAGTVAAGTVATVMTSAS
jgi:hypothetical protein